MADLLLPGSKILQKNLPCVPLWILQHKLQKPGQRCAHFLSRLHARLHDIVSADCQSFQADAVPPATDLLRQPGNEFQFLPCLSSYRKSIEI